MKIRCSYINYEYLRRNEVLATSAKEKIVRTTLNGETTSKPKNDVIVVFSRPRGKALEIFFEF